MVPRETENELMKMFKGRRHAFRPLCVSRGHRSQCEPRPKAITRDRDQFCHRFHQWDKGSVACGNGVGREDADTSTAWNTTVLLIMVSKDRMILLVRWTWSTGDVGDSG